MATELRELRTRITIEADAALDAVAKGTGVDRSEIARDVLHRWGMEQIRVATLLNSRLKAEGIEEAAERRESGEAAA